MSPELTQKLEAGSGTYTIVVGDALKKASLAEASAQILAQYNRVDVLLNVAGGNHPQATASKDNPFFDLPQDALRFVFDLNMLGRILPCQLFGKIMAEQGEGIILNLSSMAAFTPLTRVVGYSAAKAGINNFTQWLAVHMAQEYSPKIRVNALAPRVFHW